MRSLSSTIGILALLSACDESPVDSSDGGSDAGGAAANGSTTSTSSDTSDSTNLSSTNTSTVGSGAGGAGGDPGASGTTITGSGAGPSCTPGQSGEFALSIDVGGDTREVLVFSPPSDGTPRPLVIALHGFTANGEEMRDTTHFSELAMERGFVVAYPQGKNGSWNGGACCGLSEWMNEDDVGFVSAIIDALAEADCVDSARIYAAGFSNGGFLTHRLGCELADRIAAIGVVAGQESLDECTPSRAIPVLQIHGDADVVVPFGGNPVLGYPSTESTVEGWAERNGCTTESETTYDDGSTVCELRTACTDAAVVEFCRVDGGSHDWFGGGNAWVNGTPPSGFVASLAMLDFFGITAP